MLFIVNDIFIAQRYVKFLENQDFLQKNLNKVWNLVKVGKWQLLEN